MAKKKRGGKQDAPQKREVPQGVKLMFSLEGHERYILSLAFAPSGSLLASGSSDNTVKLWDMATGTIRTLNGHTDVVYSVAFDPTGRMLASGSNDMSLKLWDVESGELLRTIKGHLNAIFCVAFHSSGHILASGSSDETINLLDVESGEKLTILRGQEDIVYSLAFQPRGGRMLASGGRNSSVRLWDVPTGKLLRTFKGHKDIVYSVAFDPKGQLLASGSRDNTIKLWNVANGKLRRTLEGHTGSVEAVAFSADGQFLASKSNDDTVRIWRCESWEAVAVIPEPSRHDWRIPALVFNPKIPLLVTAGSKPDAGRAEQSKRIDFWEIDAEVLLGKAVQARPAMKAVHHTTAKIVLVGEHSVGKSGLAWRLAHKEFKEQSSTHGQQFLVLPQLGKRRDDGTECEAILWDLAGQPDYRLIHALFLEDMDLALVLFDASDISDPLHGVEYWLKQLKVGKVSRAAESGDKQTGWPTILVGAQADRGTPPMTVEELEAFCHQRGISGYISTSAKEGWGLEELTRRMKELIAWDDKPAIVTTLTFKRIKDYVLKLKENLAGQPVIVSPPELRQQLEQLDANWQFTDAEMLTAVGHLENYGYVKRLRTSKGEERVLLAPEILNNLAASFVLEARRNPKGLGSLEEKRLMEGGYTFQELEKLSPGERDILLDSAALLFLEHNVCFRETDPLSGQSYLVFPELINLKMPVSGDEQMTEDGVAYTVSGAVENVYASLVVLLCYTQTFKSTNQWQNQARYVMGDGSICGFRQESNHEGELELLLYFGTNVPKPGRKVFEGLFESFLARRNVTVFRYEPVACPNEHTINRVVVRERLRGGKGFAFCEECGEKVMLPKADEPIQLKQDEQRKVDEQRWFADQRNRFEQALFQLASYVENEKLDRPECFISYARGDKEHERWIERTLATDLQKASVRVVFDRWENERVGASLMRFIERIHQCDKVIVIGTPAYGKKYSNRETEKGFVVAAEGDLIAPRMLGTEASKESVLPLLLAGEVEESLPPWLYGRVYSDFRNERAYFSTAFNLMLRLYGIATDNKAVADLRESLLEFEMQ